jgi:L-ribulose-5-phosphate 3-epimerase
VRIPKWTRRDFVLSGARGASACALGAGCLSLSFRGSFGIEAAARGFKIGACDWTLGKRSDPAALEIAQRIGLDGIQVDLGNPANGIPLLKPAVQKAYREMATKLGVEVASLAIGALNDVPYKSDPQAEQWVAESIDACKGLGVKVVLLAFFAKGDLQNDPKGVEAVIQRLKKVAPKAEKTGVVLGFESWLSAQQHLDILNRVASPALQVYYDVGNSHKQGYDIYQEIRLLGKRICEFHAKDYDDLYGKGSIDFKEVRRAMDDIGYRGWIHMEGVKMPLGMEESCKYDERYLRGIFPRSV